MSNHILSDMLISAATAGNVNRYTESTYRATQADNAIHARETQQLIYDALAEMRGELVDAVQNVDVVQGKTDMDPRIVNQDIKTLHLERERLRPEPLYGWNIERCLEDELGF